MEQETRRAFGGNAMMPELLTVADFLARHSISRNEFYRQVNAGRIRLLKLGTASRVARIPARQDRERGA